jgi:hypothetical protein
MSIIYFNLFNFDCKVRFYNNPKDIKFSRHFSIKNPILFTDKSQFL